MSAVSRGMAGWLFIALAGVLPVQAFAQSPAPLANPPNLFLSINGEVQAIARQANGGVIIGGDFTTVNGYGRGNIARLLPDGTLDPAWNPSADGAVHAIAVDPVSGDVYAGGDFSVIGARNRAHLAKLTGAGTGAVDASWNPSPNSTVEALAVDGSGNVYVGGWFGYIGGQYRECLAKLSGSGAGAVDAAWNPSPYCDQVYALALDGSGNIFVGGWFTSISGWGRKCIAKLSASGTGQLDINWNPLGADSYVYALALDGAGHVYAGGYFANVGGQSRKFIAKLSSTGNGDVDATWNPSANSSVEALAVDGSGNVYAGGNFANIGGKLRYFVAKLSGSGSGDADAAWNPSPNGNLVHALAIDGSGNLHVGGNFTSIGGQPRVAYAVLSGSGTPSTVVADAEVTKGSVKAMARQPDGGVIVGGNFLKANGAPHANLLRLKPDGTLDPNWNPSSNNSVYALAVDGNGDVYAGGAFTSVNGTTRRYIAKLSGSGSGNVDATWNPFANFWVLSLALDGSGNLYAGGWFGYIGGQTRSRIAKLSASGTGMADVDWNPAAVGGDVYALALDGNGHLYVGGNFTGIGGLNRSHLAKLSSSSGAADIDWDPAPDGWPYALGVDGSGNLYAGGNFSTIGGQSRSRIAKLSGAGTGSIDTAWNPSVDTAGTVYALALDGSGHVHLGGSFSAVGGQGRSNIARVSANGAGGIDTSWNPSADGSINALAMDAGDNLLAGGSFRTVGGVSRTGLATLPRDSDDIFRNGFE